MYVYIYIYIYAGGTREFYEQSHTPTQHTSAYVRARDGCRQQFGTKPNAPQV
jgi:hypothetical protein